MAEHNTVDAERLRKIADIAHAGGLAGMNAQDALTAIRRLTLDVWNTHGTEAEMRARVQSAARAEPQGKAERVEAMGYLDRPPVGSTAPTTIVPDENALALPPGRYPLYLHPPTGEDTAAAQEMSDEALIDLCKQAGIRWHPEFLDRGNDRIPAHFDMLDFGTLRRLVALAQRPAAPREGVRGSGEAEPVAWQAREPNGEWGPMSPLDVQFYRERGVPVRPLYTRSEDARDGEMAEMRDNYEAAMAVLREIREIAGLKGRDGVSITAHLRTLLAARTQEGK